MADTQNVLIKLTLDGTAIEGSVALPVGRAPRRVLLPVLHSLTDTIVTLAQRQAEAAGERVSCRKGCDACCRQMVPIAPSEAFALAAVIDSLPPAQAAPILERFDCAVEELETKGLLEPLQRREQLSAAQLAAVDRAYFAAQIACPFLENRACAIHAQRPLACREFLVTSPARYCAQPEAAHVRQVALAAKPSRALVKKEGAWVPMVLARHFVAAHREKFMRQPREALQGLLKEL